MTEQKPSEFAPKHNIVVSRIIDAPVERVWKAWTDQAQVMRWWGPEFYSSPTCQIDLREGGRYIFCMRAPQEMGGQDHYNSGTYLKIVPFELLEFTQALSDAQGTPVDPVQVGMPPDFPAQIRIAVTFRRLRGDMTELTVTEYDWPMSQMYVFSLAGMHQTVDKLIASLK
jgi:uncharacterized protein YndB with AHSA1/START domain